MDDIRTVVKELHRIADAGERIANALEKQNREIVINTSFSGEPAGCDLEKKKQWIEEAINEMTENKT